MPAYTLASVDQTAFAAFFPGMVTSFFASMGLRSTSYLRLEAEAVEIAEVPFDEFRAIIYSACQADTSQTQFGGDGRGGAGVVQAAVGQFEQWRGERITANSAGGWNASLPTASVEPYIGVLRRVFYLRGIRFIVEDSRAAAAFGQAAIANTFPTGSQPISVPSVTVNANSIPAGAPAPAAGSTGAAIAAQTAMIAGLQAQIDQLRTGLATGSNAQIAASFARATAVGVELVQVFDRPLAFGYQAMFVDARTDPSRPADSKNLAGFAPVCNKI